MKEKNIMPEKDRQQTHEKIRWRELRKRILVMGLTVAMVANTVDLSVLSVSAKTDESESGKTTVVSFEELSKDITEQTLPIGALESDIKFPTSLTVTVEKTSQADEKEADDEEDASETGDTEKDDAQKDDSNGDTASSDDKKDTASSDEKDGNSGNADASDKSGNSGNGSTDTKDSDTSKDSGNSDKSGNTGASDKSDNTSTSGKSDSSSNSDKSNSSNGSNSTGSSSSSDSKSQNTGSDNFDKAASSGSSDKSSSSEGSNKSDNSNKSSSSDSSSKSDNSGSSSDTEDTQARADLPSAFGTLIGQMADALLPHKLIVHAAEKDDASDAAKTTDAPSVSNDAKKTDAASTSDSVDDAKKTDATSTSNSADNAKKSDTASASNDTTATKTTSAASDTTSSAKSVKTTGSSDTAASSETETTTEKIRLKNIKWELNVEESDAEEFDSSEASNGFCYAYTPVLPEEDGDGNQLVLGKDVELPTIYVLVGEYGIALLADGTAQVTETTKDGTETTETISGVFTYLNNTIQNKKLKKVEIKLLGNCSTTSFNWIIEINNDDTEEMILDLNGYTLTRNEAAGGEDDSYGGLVFKNNNTTITSSTSAGKIVGYRDIVEGCGLITVGNGSRLDIENVTIENQSTAPTVIVGLTAVSEKTVICTMTNATIKGKRTGGIVRAQNGGYVECTIGKGTTIQSTAAGCLCIGFTNETNKNSKFIIEDGAVLNAYNVMKDYVIDIAAADYANVIINGGTFNGMLRTAKKDTVKIREGTFGENVYSPAVSVTYKGGTLQDLMEEGYCLKTSAGEEIDLTQTDTGEVTPVIAGHLPLYFETQPSIDEDMDAVAEGYTKAPKLTVKAVAAEGEVSYQWYVDKTIDGTKTTEKQTKGDATAAIYQIPTGLPVGTYEYYCVAKAGDKEVTSKTVTFKVDEAVAETTINGEKEPQSSLEKALTAISEASEGAATLKILKDIDSETFSSKEIKGDVTIDLNDCEVGYIGDSSDWQTGIDKFGFCVTGGTVTLTDSSENKAGCLHGTLQVEGGEFSLESGSCENLKVSTGTAGVSGGTCKNLKVLAGTAAVSGGACETVEVSSGAALTVTGDSTKITTLKALHKRDARAEVTLSGGHFGSIAVEISDMEYPTGVLIDEEY